MEEELKKNREEEKAKNQYDMMTKTPVHKLIVKLSIPTILTMLGTTIYNLVDTAFVGTLGNSASGAIGVVFGLMGVLQAIGFMFGQGAGSLLSRSLGARNQKKADIIASTGFFCSLSLGIIIAAVCTIWCNPLVMMLGSTDTIAPYARTYCYCILAAAPFMVSSFTLNNFLRYEGKALLGMIGMMSGGFLNIIGDAVLMFGFRLGILGAGLSTAISQIISFCILLSMFLMGKSQTKLSIRMVSIKDALPLEIMTTGLPSLLRQALGSLGTVLLNFVAAKYGADEAVAAMSIVSRVGFGLFSVALGIGQGFQPVCAFNYGAKKYARLRSAYKVTVLLAESVMIVLSVLALIFSDGVVQVFRDDPIVIEIGTRALKLLCLAQFVLPYCAISEMLMQASGRRKWSAFLSSLRSGLLYIPALIILPYFRGLKGVQEAQPLAYVLSIIPVVILVRKYFTQIPKEDENN